MKPGNCILLAISAMLLLQMLALQPTAEAEPEIVEYDSVRFSNLYNGFAVSWTTNVETNGWIEYRTEPTGSPTRINDTRGGDHIGFTHMCVASLGAAYAGTVVYVDLFSGESNRLTATGPINITIPLVQDIDGPPPNIILYGKVIMSDDVIDAGQALVHINVTRGEMTSTNLSAVAEADGSFLLQTGNGIFFQGGEVFQPAVGDAMHILVDAGPFGRIGGTILLNETTITSPVNLGTFLLPLDFTRIIGFGVSPSSGDTDTEFTFFLEYSSEYPVAPKISLAIGGSFYSMEAQGTDVDSGIRYEYTTTLKQGEHVYSFKLVLSELDMEWETESRQINVEGTEEEAEGMGTFAIVGIAAAVLAAIIILLLFKKRSKEHPGDAPASKSNTMKRKEE